MQPEKALAYLLARPRFAHAGAAAYKPGLERVVRLLERMGNPHRAWPSVHVAGTNGKGSTVALLAAVSTAMGLRTGMYTSPHILEVTERIRIDGVPVSVEWLAQTLSAYQSVFDEEESTFFEIMTALAFRYFAEQAVDIAIIETGLGGRLDATNVLHPRMSLITTIDYDHTDLLGDTRAAIAREKAGIIKPGVPVGTVAQAEEAMAVIRSVAEQQESPLFVAEEGVRVHTLASTEQGLRLTLETDEAYYDDLEVGLFGEHQVSNISLALAALERLYPAGEVRRKAIYTGFREVCRLTGLRGRFEIVQEQPLVVVDVAHNVGSIGAVLGAFRRRCRGRCYVALGVMGDKDVCAIAGVLREAGVTVFPLAGPGARGLPAERLAAVLREEGVSLIPVADMAEALSHFSREGHAEDALLITGSHLVAEQALRLIDKAS